MRRVLVCSVLSLALAFGVGINSASATLFLSGDNNIVNPLNAGNRYGEPIDTGNQQFFTNILQGGTSVTILESMEVTFNNDVNTFYNSLAGVSSTLISGTVTAADLAGTDLFISLLPTDAFSASEIMAFDDFLSGGGSIFFLGQNDNFPTQNAYINDALAALGSGMSIVNDLFDAGFHTATGGQIATDPFTEGVSTFTYAAPSQVALVNGGTNLFFGTGGQPFVAYEEIVDRSKAMPWIPLLLFSD